MYNVLYIYIYIYMALCRDYIISSKKYIFLYILEFNLQVKSYQRLKK